MPSTVLDVVRLSTRHLADRGSRSPRLDAELLTARALGVRRLDLYLQHDRPLDDVELEPVRALLRRRAAGEPVAYILGEREFYSRSFAVTPAVLIPRPETELIVDRALLFVRARAPAPAGVGLTIADLGTGSGCVAVTLACEAPGLTVSAGDVSESALAVARANSERHGVADRVELRAGSWWEPFAGRRFDLLVSNPPYVTEPEMATLARDVRDHEPRGALAAGADGLDAYRELVGGAPAHLHPGGLVLLEIAPGLAGGVLALLQAAWPGAAIEVHADLAGLARCVELRLP